MNPSPSLLHVETFGPAFSVRLLAPEILHTDTTAAVGDALFALVEDGGARRLLLDLSEVRKISSAFLGRLIALNRLLLSLGGQLALCHLDPEVERVFTLCQLPRLLPIYATADDARRGLLA